MTFTSSQAVAPQPVAPLQAIAAQGDAQVVGVICEINNGRAQCLLDEAPIKRAQLEADVSTQMTGQIGSYLKVRVRTGWVLVTIRTLRVVEQASQEPAKLLAELDFVGEALVVTQEGDSSQKATLRGFRRGITRYPLPGDMLQTVSTADLEAVFSADARKHIELGMVYPTDRVKAALYIDPMLSKHFAILGSTGTGKSTTVALVLHRIIEQAPNAHIVMLDPHGEYAAAFTNNGVIYDTANLELPYWLMNFDEHVEVFIGKRTAETEVEVDILAKCLLAARSKSRLAAEIGRVTIDSPIPYLLSDLLNILQVNMGKLDKPDKVGPYLRLRSKIEELKNDPRYSFILSGLLVSDNFAEFLARIFRMPGDGRPISIIDLSGVPSDIVNVVVAVLSRLVFDFAVWSKTEQQRPILFVCEEAHRYVPAERLDHYGAARKILERIAKEGRKYGVSLGLVSQRPSDLSESVLSQCGTIISLRMNNERDQAYVRNAMPEGARGFLDILPALRNREAIVCGEGVAIPIRVQIDTLEPGYRPASDDPPFSTLWGQRGGDRSLIDRIIRKWRAQGR
jgi:uncharacterized protein